MIDSNAKRVPSALLLLLVLNLLISAGIIGFLAVKSTTLGGKSMFCSQQTQTAEKYTLYIGLNDKNTYRQEIPTEKARSIVNAVCAKYTDGYTSFDAQGGWVDETDTLTRENTLVYTLYDISEEQLTCMMDEILAQLNQNSILIELQRSTSVYYAGE